MASRGARKHGIGLMLEQEIFGGPVIISEVVPGGSCARTEQIRVRDRLTSVDGVPTSQLSAQELSSLIGGLEGTRVRLGIERVEGETKTFEVVVTRGQQSPASMFGAKAGGDQVSPLVAPADKESRPLASNSAFGSMMQKMALSPSAPQPSSPSAPQPPSPSAHQPDTASTTKAPISEPEMSRPYPIAGPTHVASKGPVVPPNPQPIQQPQNSSFKGLGVSESVSKKPPVPPQPPVLQPPSPTYQDRGSVAGVPGIPVAPGFTPPQNSLSEGLEQLLRVVRAVHLPVDSDRPNLSEPIARSHEGKLLQELFLEVKLIKQQQFIAHQVIQSVKDCLNQGPGMVAKDEMVRDAVRAFEKQVEMLSNGHPSATRKIGTVWSSFGSHPSENSQGSQGQVVEEIESTAVTEQESLMLQNRVHLKQEMKRRKLESAEVMKIKTDPFPIESGSSDIKPQTTFEEVHDRSFSFDEVPVVMANSPADVLIGHGAFGTPKATPNGHTPASSAQRAHPDGNMTLPSISPPSQKAMNSPFQEFESPGLGSLREHAAAAEIDRDRAEFTPSRERKAGQPPVWSLGPAISMDHAAKDRQRDRTAQHGQLSDSSRANHPPHNEALHANGLMPSSDMRRPAAHILDAPPGKAMMNGSDVNVSPRIQAVTPAELYHPGPEDGSQGSRRNSLQNHAATPSKPKVLEVRNTPSESGQTSARSEWQVEVRNGVADRQKGEESVSRIEHLIERSKVLAGEASGLLQSPPPKPAPRAAPLTERNIEQLMHGETSRGPVHPANRVGDPHLNQTTERIRKWQHDSEPSSQISAYAAEQLSVDAIADSASARTQAGASGVRSIEELRARHAKFRAGKDPLNKTEQPGDGQASVGYMSNMMMPQSGSTFSPYKESPFSNSLAPVQSQVGPDVNISSVPGQTRSSFDASRMANYRVPLSPHRLQAREHDWQGMPPTLGADAFHQGLTEAAVAPRQPSSAPLLSTPSKDPSNVWQPTPPEFHMMGNGRQQQRPKGPQRSNSDSFRDQQPYFVQENNSAYAGTPDRPALDYGEPGHRNHQQLTRAGGQGIASYPESASFSSSVISSSYAQPSQASYIKPAAHHHPAAPQNLNNQYAVNRAPVMSHESGTIRGPHTAGAFAVVQTGAAVQPSVPPPGSAATPEEFQLLSVKTVVGNNRGTSHRQRQWGNTECWA